MKNKPLTLTLTMTLMFLLLGAWLLTQQSATPVAAKPATANTPRPVLIQFNLPTTDTGYLSPTVNAGKIELIQNLLYIKQSQIVINGETQPGGRSDGRQADQAPPIIINGSSLRLGEIAAEDHNIARGLATQEGESAAVTDWNIIADRWLAQYLPQQLQRQGRGQQGCVNLGTDAGPFGLLQPNPRQRPGDHGHDERVCLWNLGREITLDALSMRGNTFYGFEKAIEYSPTVPAALRLFNALFQSQAPQAPVSITLTAPTCMPWTGDDYVLIANVYPLTTTLPITYVWQATDLAPITHTGGLEEFGNFNWSSSGNKTAQVTVSNKYGQKTASIDVTVNEAVAISDISISGPTEGSTGLAYNFTVMITPSNASPPIYTWVPPPISGQGTMTATYQWAMTGAHTISVQASNQATALIESSHTLTLFTSEVTETLESGTGGSVEFTSIEGQTTVIEVPGSALSTATTITYTELATPTQGHGDLQFAGRAFNLDASPPLVAGQGLTLTLSYSDADLAAADIASIKDVKLRYWNTGPAAWEDAAATCNPTSSYVYNPTAKTVAARVCHLTSFGLFASGGGQSVYLPLVMRQ